MPSAAGDQHGRHDRQAVEAVGEVDRVGEADDPEVGDHDEAPRPAAARRSCSSGMYKVVVRRRIGGVEQDQAGDERRTRDCSAYLCRDFRPFGSRLTILIQSSSQPISPKLTSTASTIQT